MSGIERLAAQFREKGAAALEAKTKFYQAFRDGMRERDREGYQALLSRYKTATQAALPPGWPHFLQEISRPGSGAVDTAIAFLVADPFFNESGYAKKRIIQHLKRVPLTVSQKRQLAEVVLSRIHGSDRHEIGSYGRLAAALRLPELDAEVVRLARHEDRHVARRATWILQRIASQRALPKLT